MGFALPSAIGAVLATNRRAIVISGDGGFQMNLQELEVIKRNNLPIKIFIINNEALQMIKLKQDVSLEGNSVGSKKGYRWLQTLRKIQKRIGKLRIAFGGLKGLLGFWIRGIFNWKGYYCFKKGLG